MSANKALNTSISPSTSTKRTGFTDTGTLPRPVKKDANSPSLTDAMNPNDEASNLREKLNELTQMTSSSSSSNLTTSSTTTTTTTPTTTNNENEAHKEDGTTSQSNGSSNPPSANPSAGIFIF